MDDEARATGASTPRVIGRRGGGPVGSAIAIWPSAPRAAAADARAASDLCGARSRHQQLPAADRASDRRRLSRHRRVLAHRPARRGRLAPRAASARRRSTRAIEALAICRDKMQQPRRHPRAADRDRGLPRGRERRRVPRPRRRRGRARARDRRPRDRGEARRDRLHAADRSERRRRRPVRHRRRLVRDRSGSIAPDRRGADRRCRRSAPGSRCRSASSRSPSATAAST